MLKKTKGITFGAFDLLHAGHCLMLEEAKKQCDWLIVGLQNDPSETPAEYRGKKKSKPVQSLEERYIQLKASRYVDEIIMYNSEEDLYKLLLEIKPDVRIIGADWQGKKFTGHNLPIKVYYNTRNHGYSTTELRERIKNQN
jgi:glycerol-3-phosphate cytidylyltransferase